MKLLHLTQALTILLILSLAALELTSVMFSQNVNRVAKQEMSELVTFEVAIQIQASIQALLGPKLTLRNLIASAVRTGLYAAPFDSESYFDILGNTFVAETDYLAIYQGASSRNVFKLHRQDDGYISMEQRAYANQMKQSWRFLEAGTNGTDHTFGELKPKSYDVFAKSWYLTAQELGDGAYKIQGPVVGVYPEGIFTYLEMIFGISGADGEFLAYKAEFYTDFMNDFVRDLKIGKNGRAYIVGEEGIVVALSNSEYQMTTDDEGEQVPRTFDELAEFDEGIQLAIDNALLATEEAVTFSGKSKSGTDLTISKTPVTGISVDWDIVIISVDADNLVKSRSLFSTLSILHYVIISVLILSICWEFYTFYKHFQEKKMVGAKNSNSMGVEVKGTSTV